MADQKITPASENADPSMAPRESLPGGGDLVVKPPVATRVGGMLLATSQETPASKINWILERIFVVQNPEGRLDIIEKIKYDLNETVNPIVLGFINAHAVNLMWNNAQVRAAFSACHIILRDGIGMKILYYMFGVSAGENMNGTDFIPELLDSCKSKSIVLFGASQVSVSAASKTMQGDGFHIQATLNGYHPADSYTESAKINKPDIILLGMGMPKQEIIAARLSEELDYGCLVICGGAIIDHYSGVVRRAPKWMRRLGLEWAYRLLSEPRRLLFRYVIGIPVFASRVILARLLWNNLEAQSLTGKSGRTRDAANERHDGGSV